MFTIGCAEFVRMSGYRGWYGLKNPSFRSFLVSVDRKMIGPTASNTWKKKTQMVLNLQDQAFPAEFVINNVQINTSCTEQKESIIHRVFFRLPYEVWLYTRS